jgi:putative transposase
MARLARLKEGVELWAYCLMPYHVHLIATLREEWSLSRASGEAQRRYTRALNFHRGWRGTGAVATA